jgi:hypothetical protein
VLYAAPAYLRDRSPATRRRTHHTRQLAITKDFRGRRQPLHLAIYIMSASPQQEKDVEQGVQSPDDADAQMNDPQDPHASGLAYEFEVKEQDRWLPIANG